MKDLFLKEDTSDLVEPYVGYMFDSLVGRSNASNKRRSKIIPPSVVLCSGTGSACMSC